MGNFTDSKLVTVEKISPNRYSGRNHAIDTITPHCFVGQFTALEMANMFSDPNWKASCNYCIGKDGEMGLVVHEKDGSWCSSSPANDNRAVTIECACDKTHPYAINSEVYKSLINLMTDICRRNGKTKLLWLGDKDKTLAYTPKSNEMIITVHRWFKAKECPGEYIYSRLGQIAKEVTANLQNEYKVQVGGTYTKEKAEKKVAKLKAAGFPGAKIIKAK